MKELSKKYILMEVAINEKDKARNKIALFSSKFVFNNCFSGNGDLVLLSTQLLISGPLY